MINYICFEVSALCNMDCKFCFADWRNNKKHLSYEKVISIIDKLREYGLEAINLTGGDPLLRDDIIDICKYCKEKGIMTIISTNGIELMNKKEILEYIDAINLPLDSANPDIHNEMRPCAVKNHHGLIMGLIDYINENYPNVKIKINTMVGKLNLDDVVNVGNLIEKKVRSWKLGKFYSGGYGKEFEKMFTITDEEFNDVVKACNEKYKDSKILDQFIEMKDENIYNLFIDCYGKANIHKTDGIKGYDSVEELLASEKIEKKKYIKDLGNGYLVDAYK